MSAVTAATDRAEELEALRAEVAGRALTTAEIEGIFRRVDQSRHLADLRVAWLGNHTLDPALRHATAAAFTHGVTLANLPGAFDQHFQAVLDPASALHEYAPQAIVFSLSLRGFAKPLVEGGAALSGEARRLEAERVLEQVGQWVSAAKQHTDASLLVCNFPRPPRAGLGIADPDSPFGDAALYAWLNGNLASNYRDDPRVHVVDVDHAIATAGSSTAWNPRMYHIAKLEWSGPGLAAASELIARCLCALVRPARKCLLLDLDNTVWGGIVGEDGVDGLQIGIGDPVGEAYRAFQRAVLDIKARGVLLGLVSKNNEADVEEAFERLEMPLELDHFAARRIDWEHKHVNIEAIARELNIGLSSTVFVDDNPAECELIRQMLPEVEIVQLPDDPAEYAETLSSSWHFDKLTLTEEDTRKTEQYRDNAVRTRNRQTAPDLSSYLESLGTRIEIGKAGGKQLARLHQLFSKTNQFNVTTRRYTPAELKRFAASDEWLLEWMRVRDNFGDLGLVGGWLVRLDAAEPEIDSFILSCRALGRDAETAACNHVKQEMFAAGAAALRARFVPTAKNRPAADFFERQGFRVIDTDAEGGKSYRITAAEAAPRPCPIIKVTTREDIP